MRAVRCLPDPRTVSSPLRKSRVAAAGPPANLQRIRSGAMPPRLSNSCRTARSADSTSFVAVDERNSRKHAWPASLICHRSEEHTSELQSQSNLVCRLLLEKKKKIPGAVFHECNVHSRPFVLGRTRFNCGSRVAENRSARAKALKIFFF